MTSRRTLPAVVSIAVLAALALSGCSGSSAPEGSADPMDSPLNTYMSAVWGTDIDEDEQAERHREVEDAVAVCMADEGFEYTPQEFQTGSWNGEEWQPDDREWVTQWGYGAIRYPGQEEMSTSGSVDEDPNGEYVSSLSESEQAAYYEVLYGPQPTEEELAANDGAWSPTWEEQGCWGRAYQEVNGEDPTQSEEHKPLMDALDDFWSAQQEDPQYTELDAAWADCMADAGHGGFDKQGDAAQSIYDAQTEYYESQTEFVEDDPKLDELHEQEVDLALADLDCREQTDYRAKAQAVQWELEEQFIADHKTELDALVADAEAAR